MHQTTSSMGAVRCLALIIATLSVAVGSFASSPSVTSQCVSSDSGCTWSEEFNLPDFDGDVLASVVWDDGRGPALYIGGSFQHFGTEAMKHLARWDGQGWTAVVDTAGLNVDGTVRSLVVFDDGNGETLYAGGDFETAGGQPANRLARWDGYAWSRLAGPDEVGIDGSFAAMVVHNGGYGDSLYVGGSFATAGGVVANNIARWDGDRWWPLVWIGGIGIDGVVTALTVFDGQLVVGSGFQSPGGFVTHYLAIWNGYWTPIDGIRIDYPYTVALAEFDDGRGNALYAAGKNLRTTNEVSAHGFARWDGTAWSPIEDSAGVDLGEFLGWGPDGYSIEVISQHNDAGEPVLFIGGSKCWFFDGSSCEPSAIVVRWKGNEWTLIADGTAGIVRNATVATLTPFDDGSFNALYAGGRHVAHGDDVFGNVGRWDGTRWTHLIDAPGNGIPGGGVDAFSHFNDGRGKALYAVGRFTIADGQPAAHIARWDGNSWEPLTDEGGNGTCSVLGCATPSAIVAFDDGRGEKLWIATRHGTGLGHTSINLATWDGARWSRRASTPVYYDSLNEMAVFDDGTGPAIFGCGTFSNWDESVMKFTGTSWARLPGSGGAFTGRGNARTLETWDDGGGDALYFAGDFAEAAGMVANSVIRWDGVSWSALEGPSGTGVQSSSNQPGNVQDMAIFNDGEGEALYVAGYFDRAGGIDVSNIAKWDGHRWWPLPEQPGTRRFGVVRQLTVYNNGHGEALYAASSFSWGGGGEYVNTLARWDGVRWSEVCPELFQSGESQGINPLGVHDDGSGEALFVGGQFKEFCGVAAGNIARLNCPRFDFGDAPEPPFATLLAEDGARHVVKGGLHLGEGVSHEPDGKPSLHADSDDFDDGVSFASPLIPGFASQVEVRSSADAVLDAWIDFNDDGDWDDPGDRVFDHQPVSAGTNQLSFVVPSATVVGTTTVARFRVSSTGIDSPTGEAPDGEAEDYEIEVSVNPTRAGGGRVAP